MASRSTIIVFAFLAGAAVFALAPGLSTAVQRSVGIGTETKAKASKPPTPDSAPARLLPMSDEQIKLAQIELATVSPATIAKRLVVVVLLTGGRLVSGPAASGVAGNVYKNLAAQNYAIDGPAKTTTTATNSPSEPGNSAK